ncbi:hypothetical protein IW150_002310 [Coemansia sp. RSA 2607]|nr:hypothetical protein IW150_002310 [Coemansia sp. RSA 2607]
MYSAGNLSVAATTLGGGTRRSGGSLLYSSGGEERVVLDLGAELRAGFSTDARPLYTSAGVQLTPADAHHARLLSDTLRTVYREYLLVDAKTRKVAVVDHGLSREARLLVARVLLSTLRAPLVTFYPAAVASLVTCGRSTGLVVDCGVPCARVAPVYDGRLLAPYVGATAVGQGMLRRSVRGLVMQFGRFHPAQGKEEGVPVDEHVLSDEVVEFLARKTLYAASVPPPDPHMCRALGVGSVDPALAEWFEANRTSPTAPSTTCLTVKTPSTGGGLGTLSFPSWIRERATEVLLWGDAPADLCGLVDCVVHTVARCPMDTRRALVHGILVVGALAEVPGLRARLLQDVVDRLRKDRRWNGLADDAALAEVSHGAGMNAVLPAERPWVGVALAVAARIGGDDVKLDSL